MTMKMLQPEIDHGTGYFDVVGFAAAALASEASLAAVFRSHIAEAGGDPGTDSKAM